MPKAVAIKDADTMNLVEAYEEAPVETGKLFAKFNAKTGDLTYGAEETEIADTCRIGLNMASYARGYICWKDGTPVDEVMELVASRKVVDAEALKDYGPYDSSQDGWKANETIEIVLLDDNRTQCTLTGGSLGVRRALGKLGKEFAGKVRETGEMMVPIITVESDSYKHPTYGKIFTPKVEVVEWIKASAMDDYS